MNRLTALLLLAMAHAAAAPLPYQNPALSVPERVQDLLSRMTTEEKAGQLVQVNVLRLMQGNGWTRGPLDPGQLNTVLAEAKVGSVLSGGGAAPQQNTPVAWAELTHALQKYALEHSRLKIPIIYGVDAVHGHNNVLGATMFPHNLGLAATFDPALARKVAASTARAVKATGISWNFAPDADLGRDPRWGRFYETFGEDPNLASALVAAQVHGFQDGTGVAATVKHFIGYGQAPDGKDRAPATVSQANIQNLLLPPFQAALDAGAMSVMVNSGALNGKPVHASSKLLTDLLRQKLKFSGVTISDWDDIAHLKNVHQVAHTDEAAITQAVNAGVDVMMVPLDAASYAQKVTALVKTGQISQTRLNEAAGRVLALKFRLGLFEHPYVDAAAVSSAVKEDALANQAAAASLTLLKNNGVLPLTIRTPRVLVVGEAANDPRFQLGGWSVDWQGVPVGQAVPAVTVLDGLKATLPQGLSLRYVSGNDADALKAAAQQSDLIVSVIGEKPGAEGEADSPNLALPDFDLQRVQALKASGKPVVTVLLAGRPLDLRTVLPASDAFLMAYLPGTQGGKAVADVLWGSRNPSGRLPFAWPTAAQTLPSVLNQPSQTAPLFPFGAGLSYTTFEEKNWQVNTAARTASVTVSNTGKRAGRHTVLAFTGQGPDRQLVAVGQVTLRPDETKNVVLQWITQGSSSD